jgi:hypothetical protein
MSIHQWSLSCRITGCDADGRRCRVLGLLSLSLRQIQLDDDWKEVAASASAHSRNADVRLAVQVGGCVCLLSVIVVCHGCTVSGNHSVSD